jgi:biotin synthase
MDRRKEFSALLQGAEEGRELSDGALLTLLGAAGDDMERLIQAADRVRRRSLGDKVNLRGIIEFSNHCRQNCLYCGLRRDNGAISRYRMEPLEILAAVEQVQASGIRTVVLQSGEDPWYTQERINDLIRWIKERTGLAITLSLGERSRADYETWRKAGADRYLLKHETASPALFRRLRPGRELQERLAALQWLRELSYEVGSGNMVGLPGQTDLDLVADIRTFRERDFDMIGVGPFIANPQTPLAGDADGTLDKVLKVLAVTRDTNLPATTAAGVLNPDGRRRGLLAGANVIMLDMTPGAYRRRFEIYPGKTRVVEPPEAIFEMIASLGREIAADPGARGIRKRVIN